MQRAAFGGSQPMSWDKRAAKRVHFDHEHRVTLVGADGTWKRECIFVDVSDTGARLRMDGSPDVLRARQFFLLLSSTGLAFRRCELVRLEGTEVGIRFFDRGGARAPSALAQKRPQLPK